MRNITENEIDVSIVIVCMNNLKDLYPCLDSIKKYTTVDYETLVVAYLFTKENLQKLKVDYPWVTIIESNEVRGFSENNNLALRYITGRYCFILNDDTFFHAPVIDELVDSIKKLPENVAVISPKIVYPNGEIQYCGRAYMDWKTFALQSCHLWNEKKPNKYIDQNGVFKSYNIVGAAFLIKTEIFKELGWFDEYYFFCPEDIALSTLLNEEGYECYVNADISIIHKGGMSYGTSLNMIKTAIKPAARVGSLKFFARGNLSLFYFLGVIITTTAFIKFLIYRSVGLIEKRPNEEYILSIVERNILLSTFSKKSPKDIFIDYYKEL